MKDWEPDQVDTDNALAAFAIAVSWQAIGIVRTAATALGVLIFVVIHSVIHHLRHKGETS